MTADRRTKAQILDDLERTRKRLDEVESQKSVTIERPQPVPEAVALEQCIRALDALVSSRRSSGGYGSSNLYAFSGDYPRSQTDVERILRLLAARHDIPLVEVRTEPCHRRHLDELNPDRIVQALSA